MYIPKHRKKMYIDIALAKLAYLELDVCEKQVIEEALFNLKDKLERDSHTF